jgi:hypothetical protein
MINKKHFNKSLLKSLIHCSRPSLILDQAWNFAKETKKFALVILEILKFFGGKFKCFSSQELLESQGSLERKFSKNLKVFDIWHFIGN